MEYLLVTWMHDFPDEPNEFYMEICEVRVQVRVLELYKNGEFAYATTEKVYKTFLAKEPYPSIEEINSTEEVRAKIISKEEFEKVWDRYVNKPI